MYIVIITVTFKALYSFESFTIVHFNYSMILIVYTLLSYLVHYSISTYNKNMVPGRRSMCTMASYKQGKVGKYRNLYHLVGVVSKM